MVTECLWKLPVVTNEIDDMLLQFLSDGVDMSKSAAGFAAEKAVAVPWIQQLEDPELQTAMNNNLQAHQVYENVTVNKAGTLSWLTTETLFSNPRKQPERELTVFYKVNPSKLA
eukprot:2901093-Rhodomonas_salina.1